MCLFHRRSKSNPSNLNEKAPYPISPDSTLITSPKTSFTGKRRSNQTLENPNGSKSSYNDLRDATVKRLSHEQYLLPMPRTTPGGLPKDSVLLSTTPSPSTHHELADTQVQSYTNTGYAPTQYSAVDGSDGASSGAFGAMNGAASVAVMTSGAGGY